MPVGCRNVEPVRLGAHTVDQEGEDNIKIVHLTVANNAIVGTLLQLSSLVRHADDLFCDISDECQKVIERTDKINSKLKQLESRAGKLDAKQVSVRKYLKFKIKFAQEDYVRLPNITCSGTHTTLGDFTEITLPKQGSAFSETDLSK